MYESSGMKFRCVSSTESFEACHEQTPQKAKSTRTTATVTIGLTSTGPYMFSRNLPTRPPLCAGGLQHIWLGSGSPLATAASASSTATVGQHGQPLGRQKQQSILPLFTRQASNVTRAVKSVSCMTKRSRTAKAANMQKDESAGRAEDTEMMSATKSVREVTMMETPAWEMACAMRWGTGKRRSVWSRAFMMTKESSTPMPSTTNGRMEWTGVYLNWNHMERP
mmetsp:Transcript_142224/g.442222  ORF Transcript_142224/g.442222 Transcript_142224/m.442222 type:complete len:223 (-) Transcript_142224:1010-1678(-)